MGSSVVIFIVIVIIIMIIVYFKTQKNPTTANSNHESFIIKFQEARLYLEELYQTKKIKTINTDIMLKKGEKAYLIDYVVYVEMRSKSVSTRGGAAIRIAKGVYIGGSQGQSRSVPEMRCIDKGKLVLTNKRVIFNGENTTKEYKIDSILSVETDNDIVCFSCEGKEKKPQFHGIDNVFIWKALISLLKKYSDVKEFPNAMVKNDLIYAIGQENYKKYFISNKSTNETDVLSFEFNSLLERAKLGDADAQFNLGFCYEQGDDIKLDYKEAVKWYLIAAGQGYAQAQCSLGVMYLNGNGVTQNYPEALKWFQLAAEHGYAYAQAYLGILYDNGQGVTQDYEIAVKWYRLAAE